MDPNTETKKNSMKSRLLFLQSYLLRDTDVDHPARTDYLIRILQGAGFSADARTLRNDIDMLISGGYCICSIREGKYNAYYLDDRDFDLSELRMLIDAVSSSRFISREKSEELTEKLASLASVHQRDQLKARVFTADRIKADDDSSLVTAEWICEAIEQKKKISFQYYDYTPDKRKVLKHDGEVYVCSPYAIVWNDDRYYLIGYSDKHQNIGSFRLDRMKGPRILQEEAKPDEEFNPAEYTRHAVKMFGGRECEVTLRCRNDLMKNVIDRFGEDIETWTVGRDYFDARLQVQISRTFYSWVFQFAGGIDIVAPEDIREEYRTILKGALS